MSCNCNRQKEIQIDSIKSLHTVKKIISNNIENDSFEEIKVTELYYVGTGIYETIAWYVDNRYRRKICNTLWEIKFPDFLSEGFFKKFNSV